MLISNIHWVHRWCQAQHFGQWDYGNEERDKVLASSVRSSGERGETCMNRQHVAVGQGEGGGAELPREHRGSMRGPG